MSDWNPVSLDRLVRSGAITLGRGDVISRDDIHDNPGPYAIYSSSAQSDGRFGEYNDYMFDEELITWSVDGGGRLFYRPKHKYSVTNVCGFMRMCSDQLCCRFIHYLLEHQHASIQFDYQTKAHPSVIRHMYEIPVLPLPEQQNIAAILTTVDLLIEQTEALIEKYRRVKQGMMADLLSRGVDENGRLRPTRQQAPELYKQSELGWIPKEWEVRELSHFLSYISYGFTNPMPETQDGPWMVTAANVQGGRIQYRDCRHTSQTAYDTLLTNKCRPRINDILLTKDGTLGRLAIVDQTGICINQSVAVLRTNEKTSPLFIKLLLEAPHYQQKMLDDAGGSTIKHIYITVVDKMLIAVPMDTDEQDRICRLINLESQLVTIEKLQLTKLRTLKTGLMQDLLTGKVRVNVDEAEEVTAGV